MSLDSDVGVETVVGLSHRTFAMDKPAFFGLGTVIKASAVLVPNTRGLAECQLEAFLVKHAPC